MSDTTEIIDTRMQRAREMVKAGRSVRQICSELHVSTRTFYEWKEAWGEAHPRVRRLAPEEREAESGAQQFKRLARSPALASAARFSPASETEREVFPTLSDRQDDAPPAPMWLDAQDELARIKATPVDTRTRDNMEALEALIAKLEDPEAELTETYKEGPGPMSDATRMKLLIDGRERLIIMRKRLAEAQRMERSQIPLEAYLALRFNVVSVLAARFSGREVQKICIQIGLQQSPVERKLMGHVYSYDEDLDIGGHVVQEIHREGQ